MFRKPTTFILGAGASWHYGYPTGEGLIAAVIDAATKFANFCQKSIPNNHFLPEFMRGENLHRHETWHRWSQLALELARRLRVSNPTLIDYFLKQNTDLQVIGKLAIACVIFGCERDSNFGKENTNRRALHSLQMRRGERMPHPFDPTAFKDDWLRFILHKLTVGCSSSSDLLSNDVRFVTFNYDTSLERRLIEGLSCNSLIRHDHVRQFVWEDARVTHIYGSVRNEATWNTDIFSELPASLNSETMHHARTMLQAIYNASLGLRTIDGDDKEVDNQALGMAHSHIVGAERIYMLGFGFDETNTKRLKIRAALDGEYRHGIEVMFTNFGGSNRVSKAAGRLFGNDPRTFLPPNTPTQRISVGQYGWRMCEMSTKDTYEALEQDFESFELD